MLFWVVVDGRQGETAKGTQLSRCKTLFGSVGPIIGRVKVRDGRWLTLVGALDWCVDRLLRLAANNNDCEAGGCPGGGYRRDIAGYSHRI